MAKLAAVIATHAFSENTNKGYASHIKSWLLFCLYFSFDCLPATDAGLSQYLVFQAQSVSPSSLQIYMCGIRSFHIDNGFSWPHVSSRPQVHRTMRGLKRVFGVGPKQKFAITLEILMAMRGHMDFDKLADVMWWAAALTAFFGCFRKDNVTVDKESSFNSSANLSRGDFSPQSGNWENVFEEPLWIRVRRSKTNQSRAKVHYIPLIPSPGSALCPVAAVVRAFALSPSNIADSAPFYSVNSAGEFQPLSHQIFVRRTKELIFSIGRNPDDYSGHSFRIGAATLSFTLTPRHELIKGLGDWASDAYLGYDRPTPDSKCLLPALMSLQAARVSRACISPS